MVVYVCDICFHSSSNTIRVDTSISSFEVGLSDSSLRALVHATSSHMDTALQLLRAIALTGDQGDQREDFRGYVGKAELTHSRLAEVANSINQSSGPISKHYLRSGGVEEVDGRSGYVSMYVCVCTCVTCGSVSEVHHQNM